MTIHRAITVANIKSAERFRIIFSLPQVDVNFNNTDISTLPYVIHAACCLQLAKLLSSGGHNYSRSHSQLKLKDATSLCNVNDCFHCYFTIFIFCRHLQYSREGALEHN